MASAAPDGVLDASAVSFMGADDRRRLAIVLVGLPARGKSFTAHKLVRYLTWLGHETRHFNVGKYRREFVGADLGADFFSAGNAAAVASRTAVARVAAEEALSWMENDGGHVVIFDATNSTRERRAMLQDIFRGRCKTLFLEMLCTDAALIHRNVLEKVHASPDYAEVAPDEATADFYSRMRAYEEAYETVDEAEGLAYIKLRDLAAGAGSLTASRLSGFLPSRIVYLLLNAQLAFRPIFLCRHGESRDNIAGRVGGDSSLSSAGRDFASRLRSFVEALPPAERPAAVWTSTLRRTVQTARGLGPGWPTVQWRALDEIDAGKAEGLTYGEMRAQMPEEHAARSADKLRYRYPRGESYLDVIARLEPVERQRSPVLIVGHQAVLRALLGYFTTRRIAEVPHIDVPLHTVVRLTPSSYGMREDRVSLGPDPSPGGPSS